MIPRGSASSSFEVGVCGSSDCVALALSSGFKVAGPWRWRLRKPEVRCISKSASAMGSLGV